MKKTTILKLTNFSFLSSLLAYKKKLLCSSISLIKGNGILFSSFVILKKIKTADTINLIPSLNLVPIKLFDCFSNKNIFSLLTNQINGKFYYRLFYNLILGGFRFWFEELELVGLGYRLTVKGNTLRLRLGFSHVIILTIPEGVFLIKRKKRLLIYSTNKSTLTFFVSWLVRLRKMNVYKIKGIKKKNQVFNLKPGKKRAK